MIHGVIVDPGPVQVVFLHGLLGQRKNFTRIATFPAGIVICYLLDLPNHGAPSWTVGLTLDGQPEHIVRQLRENFEGPVALAEHSLGGRLVMRLALAYPGLVDRLLVAGISSVPSDGPTELASLMAAIRSLDLEHLTSQTEASRRFADATSDPQIRGFLLQNLRRFDGDWAWEANLNLLGDPLRVIGGRSRMDAVYDGPAWWVAERQSPYVLLRHAESMRRLSPRTVTIALRHASHWMRAGEPEVFTSICTEFLTLPATVSSA